MKKLGSLVSVSTTTLAVALAVAAGGCKEERQGRPTPSTFTTAETQITSAEAGASPAATQVATPAPLSSSDREFMMKAAQGSMLEVAIGNAVAPKVTTPDAKAFATHMVHDHGKATTELQQIAAKKGITLPADLDKDHKKKVDELTKLSGKKLDKELADEMVDDHEEDVKELRRAVQDVKDPDLHMWAMKTLPVLEGHLQMAKDLKTKVK